MLWAVGFLDPKFPKKRSLRNATNLTERDDVTAKERQCLNDIRENWRQGEKWERE
jgi:hypothetical protein